ncbi:MAG: chemotaxis protein CheA [Gammaproteobacteria bacterium]|nr:chemotaxis protein CheA [Gammaproteobacteria bacterium]
MTVDMSQFYQTFFEESFEGLDNMEASLLTLQDGEADLETVNTIFRAAHSIKGGAATFGFDAVSSFTHVMETLLDQVRGGERMVTQPMIDLLLKSGDALRDMLAATRDGTEYDVANVKGIKSQLEAMLHGGHEAANTTPASALVAAPEAAEAPSMIEGWHIKCHPHEHMMRTGNDPVRLFREISVLGELTVELDDSGLPPLAEIDPENSYLSWNLTLMGDVDRSQINEVFEWVDDDCDIGLTVIGSEEKSAPMTPVAEVASVAEVVSEEAPNTVAPAPVASAPPAPVVSPSAPVVAPAVAAAVDSAAAKVAEKRKVAAASGDTGSIRVSTDKIDALINMVGELVITQSMLSQWGDADNDQIKDTEKLRDGLAQLERNTRELQESVMRIRMLPISFVFQRFPRMVRDLAQKLGKEVELKLSGEQTELDKTVMEKIGDPMVHLVRNSMDHGIERPDVRKAAGKDPVGTVHLDAYHQGGNIVIEITDDGAGLNRQRIKQKAIERGVIAETDELSDERIHELIFEPGFSTAAEVSDVSGRGVGMDVVRRNIRELGGSIEIHSKDGEGSKFTIRLPLTLAILDGQLVRVGNDTYIIPLVSIIESLQVSRDRVNAIAAKSELYKLRDEYIPVVRLYEVFGRKSEHTDLSKGLLVVVEGDGQRVGVFVDDLLGQQQVVIKSLETNFRRVDGISGATILGDGTVALILDVGGLISLSKDKNVSKRRADGGNANNQDAQQAVA